MKRSIHFKLLTFILLCSSISVIAQDQQGVLTRWDNGTHFAFLDTVGFSIIGDPSPCSSNSFDYNFGPSVDPFHFGPYCALPGGHGPRTFEAIVSWQNEIPFTYQTITKYLMLVDGEECPTCEVKVQLLEEGLTNSGFNTGVYKKEKLTITHSIGNAWESSTLQGHHAISLLMLNESDVIFKVINFSALFVGTSYTTEVTQNGQLGTFVTPALPLYILRDPPGDNSYSELSSTESTCVGQTFSVTDAEEQGAYEKVKLGTSGSVGLIVMTDWEVYGEVGVDVTGGRQETSTEEYQTCITTTSTFSTPQDGPADDLYIGSAIKYAYGTGRTISRNNGCEVTMTDGFAIAPVETVSSYNYTESYILGTVIPAAADFVSSLTPGTNEHKFALGQLNAWNDAIALNAELKANAKQDVVRSFNGGGGQNYSLETTSSESKSIETSVFLDSGFSAEFGLCFGGSGVTAGGEIRFKTEYGKGSSGSNETTNSMSYYLGDDDESDSYSVSVKQDDVFSTYVFESSPSDSTSCPYESGYQLDRPALYVGAKGSSEMTIDNAIIGEVANFPLYVCNDSNRERTYHLKFRAETNTENAQLNGFGADINGTDDGVELVVPANDCLDLSNLELRQPSDAVVDFDDIEVFLYSLCEPELRSAVTISAHFSEISAVADIESETDWYSAYPNPSNGLIKLISTSTDLRPVVLRVMDATGREVIEAERVTKSGNIEVDLQSLEGGVYHLILSRENQRQVVPIVIVK